VILTGWKQISSYLGYGVRTVQRWESEGLPVTRVTKSPRSPVVVDSEELDAWILHRSRPPNGAPQAVVNKFRRAQQLRRELVRKRKALEVSIEKLMKTLADLTPPASGRLAE
jgi:hypothetical protein